MILRWKSNYSINQKKEIPRDLVVIDGAFAEQFVAKGPLYMTLTRISKVFDTYSKDKFIPAALRWRNFYG